MVARTLDECRAAGVCGWGWHAPGCPHRCPRCAARMVGTVTARPWVAVYACGSYADGSVILCAARPRDVAPGHRAP